MFRKLQLSDFELGDVLGTGTVGTIYRAKEIKSGREVALKMLLPSAADDPLISARFEREIHILERLNHPNIIRYFGNGRDGRQLFYTMEVVEGAALKKVIADSGPLTWQEAANIGIQIGSALQHAHNNGVIHRDLKPANIYVSREGQAKLGDFGIALDTNANTLTHSGLTVGTYAYMAPEQITNEEQVTGKADLYAFGCLLFMMLTGRTPFIGASFPQMFEQHLKDAPPKVRELAPDCPEKIEALVDDLLKKKAEERPFNARSAQGRLLEVLGISEVTHDVDAASSKDVPAQHIPSGGHDALVLRMSRIKENVVPAFSWRRAIAIVVVMIVILCAAIYFGT